MKNTNSTFYITIALLTFFTFYIILTIFYHYLNKKTTTIEFFKKFSSYLRRRGLLVNSGTLSLSLSPKESPSNTVVVAGGGRSKPPSPSALSCLLSPRGLRGFVVPPWVFPVEVESPSY